MFEPDGGNVGDSVVGVLCAIVGSDEASGNAFAHGLQHVVVYALLQVAGVLYAQMLARRAIDTYQ